MVPSEAPSEVFTPNTQPLTSPTADVCTHIFTIFFHISLLSEEELVIVPQLSQRFQYHTAAAAATAAHESRRGWWLYVTRGARGEKGEERRGEERENSHKPLEDSEGGGGAVLEEMVWHYCAALHCSQSPHGEGWVL